MDRFRDVLDAGNQKVWMILALQSGFLNAGGFLACHRFVSHVTGFGTQIGISIGRHDYGIAFEVAFAPFCFLAGATLAGWLIDRQLLLGREPRLLAGLVTISALIAATFLGGELSAFGPFGEPLFFQHDFLLLFTLSFTCGLQNGLFVGLTNGFVRTTHLTGLTTDIGINLAKFLTYPAGDPERRQAGALNALRVRIVTSFSFGSLVAVLVFENERYLGFAVPFATSLVLAAYVRYRVKGPGPRLPWRRSPGSTAGNPPTSEPTSSPLPGTGKGGPSRAQTEPTGCTSS